MLTTTFLCIVRKRNRIPHIGTALRFIAERRKFCQYLDRPQEQIAKILGTSQTMYARYERGANSMPIHHLVTLCHFYNVSADYFLGTTPNPHRPQKQAAILQKN